MGSMGSEGLFSPGTPRRLKRKARVLLQKAEEKRRGVRRAHERKAIQRGDIAGRIVESVGTLEEAHGTVRLHAWLPAIPLDIYAWIEGREAREGQGPRTRTRVEPGVCLEERWRTERHAPLVATWTFESHDGGTLLTLVQRGVPSAEVASQAAYWQRHVFDALQRLYPS